ncbi:MAG TPA: 30S ribosomal protein S12 methylthiotransferase RimO, partial [Chloroflexia bacterium]
MPKFNIVTLGCEKNNVDSEGMGSLLVEAGYEQSASPEDSDLLIVNTCAFLQAAVDESVGELKALAEHKREGQVLISAGCMSERYAADVPTWVPGVDGTISTRAWPEIVPFVEKLRGQGPLAPLQMQSPVPAVSPLITEITPASIAWAPIAPVQMTSQLKRFRRKANGPSAYVKISEGCDHKCAFCIIPAIWGKHISRPVEE